MRGAQYGIPPKRALEYSPDDVAVEDSFGAPHRAEDLG